MSFPWGVNNPGIGGLDELTSAEELFVQNLAGLSYASGDIIYHDGSNLARLAKGSNGQYLKLASGIPSWAAPAGSGDVVGPASATNNALARFDTTTGKLLQNSLVTADDSGSVNIPTGQTYKINGTSLTYSDVSAINDTTDVIKDTHIDWGTGANQVSAVDIVIADAGSKITATEVEGAFQENRTAIDLNTAKTTNATHTGEVTGTTALTIANDAVTYAKMQDTSGTDKILGRSTAGAGTIEEITCTSAGRAILDDANASAQRTTLGLVIGTNVLAEQTIGIANDNLIEIDDADAADNDYCKLTANGIEGRSYAEVLSDIGALASTSYDDATAAETNTGTSTAKYVSPDGLAGSNLGIRYLQITCFDYTTDTATGDGKGYFHIPAGLNGMNLISVHAEVITAGTTGTTDIQIHNLTQTADMLSTKITIDTGETGSDTAATPAVIDAANDDVATNDLIRIDVDAVSTTAAKGLIITLGFRIPQLW